MSGQAINGVIQVSATINVQLDAAGSFLMVDGQPYGYQRLSAAPYLYSLSAASLSNGTHSIQVWAHDTNNETLLSAPVSISVSH